jgi:transposase
MANGEAMERDMLRDDQWERIAPMLAGKPTDAGRTAADNRLFVESVLWILRTGSPWRDLPKRFGPWNSVYQRFSRWSRRGSWHRVFDELAKDGDFEEQNPYPGWHDRPRSSARKWCGKKNGPQALGRSRGGLTTKIHAAIEGLGNLAGFILTGGHIHDSTEAQSLIDRAAGLSDDRILTVTADKGYDSASVVAHIEALGASAVIPQLSTRKVQRPVDWAQYKNRNLVERFFARLKQFRRVATRYDKLAERFASFISLAAAYIWLV